MRDQSWFKHICDINSLNIMDEQLLGLSKYVDLLILKNREVNLISNKSESNVWEDHILHSLSFLFLVKLKTNSKILDLGSGGGLPGIPLKILYPDMDITLLDSTKKKIIADNEMIRTLGLKNIKGISYRAEEINNNSEYSGKYDYVIARAVSSLDNILDWARPFLKSFDEENNISGVVPFKSIIILKGGEIEEEVREIKNKNILKEIKTIDLKYRGSDTLSNPDKKIVILQIK
jgi:16S rRNA (guanine527-N7)-methyltransferase